MLNSTLYRQLKRLFGEVHIANENIPLDVEKILGDDDRLHPWKKEGGEEYRVCCPMCGDTRFRLYVNHAWGLDRQSKYPTSKLVKCHNENCEEADRPELPYSGNAAIYLRKNLAPYFSDIKLGLGPILKTPTPEEKAAYAQPLEFPKPEWCALMKPGDMGYEYLQSRRFNPMTLEREWGVKFAWQYPVQRADKDYSWLAGRLFIPTENGWQARDLSGVDKIKYFSCPGWRKSQEVYNLSRARQQQLAVVVEGVTDVWRVGAPGVCIYGKAISDKQVKLLAENFNTVVVLLDPDAFTRDARTGKTSGRKTISALTKKVSVVHRVDLPDGRDPADCTHKMIWNRIEEKLKEHGIQIARPTEDVNG